MKKNNFKMKKPISAPKKEGIKCYVLVFDGTKGKHVVDKKTGLGKLNPIKKHECISVVDARVVLLIYLKPAQIPPLKRCREIVKKDGYLSVTKIKNYYFFS